MKVTSSALLAVSLLQAGGAAAFMTPPPSAASSTAKPSSTSTCIFSSSDPSGRGDVNVGNVGPVGFSMPRGGPQAQGGSLSTVYTGPLGKAADMQAQFDTEALHPIVVQGGALRTWSFPTPYVERVLVHLYTDDRVMESYIQLCQGPDNTPQAIRVSVDKGALRPFKCVMETPHGNSAVFIRNRGPLEFPTNAKVGAKLVDGAESPGDMVALPKSIYDAAPGTEKIIQGNAVHSRGLDVAVECCKVILRTNGRPLNARIELIQGPEANKYVIEVYTEDGEARPFCALVQTPGVGNTIRIVNTAPVEFPMYVSLEPCTEDGFAGPESGGGISRGPGESWENGGNGYFMPLGS